MRHSRSDFIRPSAFVVAIFATTCVLDTHAAGGVIEMQAEPGNARRGHQADEALLRPPALASSRCLPRCIAGVAKLHGQHTIALHTTVVEDVERIAFLGRERLHRVAVEMRDDGRFNHG